jgi:hypothetical protein
LVSLSTVRLSCAALWRETRNIPDLPSLLGQVSRSIGFFASESKEVPMRRLLLGSAAVFAAALAATPAAAQYYGYSPYSYGYSPYSYGYSYPSYSYPSYGYSYPSYSYGYSYPSYSYGYSNYGYSYPTYRYRSSYSCRLRRHHHNGMVWYTRSC